MINTIDLRDITKRDNLNIEGLSKFDIDKANYQIVETSIYRDRESFCIFPVFFKKKLYWFTKVIITERLTLHRFKEFDDGWHMSLMWNSWKEIWDIENIIKLNNKED